MMHELLERLKKNDDAALLEMWKRPLCYVCDYSGFCECSWAGRILAGRGFKITDRHGQPVEPING